jgi:pimeloyl-ACP methyl ester carboxylesterase
MRLRLCLIVLLAALPLSALRAGTPPWKTLPPTPSLPAATRSGTVAVDGAKIYYAQFGTGRPVVLLHGGIGNSDYWGHLVPALVAKHFQVTVIDSRGHGRSTRTAAPFHYARMADDVVGVLDALKIERTDLVGWSDGGIIGLDLAIRHPTRLRRMAIYGANSDPSGTFPDVEKAPIFAAYIERAAVEYAHLSPTPKEFDAFVTQVQGMWASEPRYRKADLRRITIPTLVFDGAHEEAIRTEHTRYLARTIPHATLKLLPDASHFGMLQTPEVFNAAVIDYLDVP